MKRLTLLLILISTPCYATQNIESPDYKMGICIGEMHILDTKDKQEAADKLVDESFSEFIDNLDGTYRVYYLKTLKCEKEPNGI